MSGVLPASRWWAALGVVLAFLLPAALRAEDVPAEVLDEVTVNGERTGPGLWHVHHGDAHLWILGSMAPLPKGITWRSKQVEQLLDTTQRVMIQKPFDIGIVRIVWLFVTQRKLLMVRGGDRLNDVMPADLHARFAAQRAKYTDDADKWERYRPIIASAFLQQAAFHKIGLSTRIDLGAAMRTLAKKHDVPVEELKIAGVHDVLDALKTMSPATENACVEASLATVETGLPRLQARAQAWATGNVEQIARLRDPQELDACRVALEAGSGAGELIAQIRRTWMEGLEKTLHGHDVTLAVVNMDLLLEKGGLLDQLRGKGYVIDAP